MAQPEKQITAQESQGETSFAVIKHADGTFKIHFRTRVVPPLPDLIDEEGKATLECYVSGDEALTFIKQVKEIEL